MVTSFTGVGQTLRRIGNYPAAIRATELLWKRESDPNALIPPFGPAEVMTDLLDPIDVEDLVLLYLQAQGWLLIPSSRMHDTPDLRGCAPAHRHRAACSRVGQKRRRQ